MYFWYVILLGSAVSWGAWNWGRYRRTDRGEMWLTWLAITIGGAKIWLASGQPQFAVPVANHVDWERDDGHLDRSKGFRLR